MGGNQANKQTSTKVERKTKKIIFLSFEKMKPTVADFPSGSVVKNPSAMQEMRV